jgi:hypothetical protein
MSAQDACSTPTVSTIAQSNTFDNIVATVSSAFNPKIDSRIMPIVNGYDQSAEAYKKSPTLYLLAKRMQAFDKLQQLRNEVRSRISLEVIKHANSSPPGKKRLEKTKS